MMRALLVLPLMCGFALAAEPVFPPGSRIGLVPADGMVVSRGMTGFQDRASGATIVAIEMPPEAYPGVVAGFTEEALKSQGFTASARETIRIGNAEGLLVSGEQTEGGRATPKTFLIAAEASVTAMVIAQLPPGAPAEARERVAGALRTVSIRPALSMDDQISALPFRLADQAGFRPLRVMAGNSLLLTEGPLDVIRNADQPIMIVAQSFGAAPRDAEQRDVFARTALVSNALLKDTVFERSQGFRQRGSEWHEIVVRATDAPSSQPVVVMQTIRFDPDGYLRMVGIVRADQRDDILPRFRRMVDAIAPK